MLRLFRYFFQLSELFIEMKYKLFSRTFVVIIQCSICHILSLSPLFQKHLWKMISCVLENPPTQIVHLLYAHIF